jgi:hypothetical protein
MSETSPNFAELIPIRSQELNQLFHSVNLKIEGKALVTMVSLNVRQNFIKTDFASQVFRTERQLRHGSPDCSLFGGELKVGFLLTRRQAHSSTQCRLAVTAVTSDDLSQ